MKKEIWKFVPGYDGLYMVSNLGRVKSLNYNHTGKEKVLKPFTVKGYYRVRLAKNGVIKNYQVHRLVWEAFNGPIPEGMQVNHISERKDQNNLENLNLMSCKENINWGTGIRRSAKSKSKMVEQYTLDGEHIMTWFSVNGVQKELSHLGFDESAISACCLGKRKTHKGYIWKYVEREAV